MNTTHDVNQVIALNLHYKDVLSLCQTNQQFKNICNDAYFWSRKMKLDFPNVNVSVTNQTEYIKQYKQFEKQLEIFNRFFIVTPVSSHLMVANMFIQGDAKLLKKTLPHHFNVTLQPDLYIANVAIFIHGAARKNYVFIEHPDPSLMNKLNNHIVVPLEDINQPYLVLSDDDLLLLNLDDYDIYFDFKKPSLEQINTWTKYDIVKNDRNTMI